MTFVTAAFFSDVLRQYRPGVRERGRLSLGENPADNGLMPQIWNIAAYKFVALDRLTERQEDLRSRCREWELKGTILLSPEGINLFVAGTERQVGLLLEHLRQEPALADLEIKQSPSDRQPFNRMLVKVKKEIITFGKEGIAPAEYTSRKMAPQELQERLGSSAPPVLLDVRNTYETRLGTFKDAVRLDIDHFRQFPAAVEQLPEEFKSRPIVMFCTGGIRCEKAGPFMEQQGFQEVYQLDGGILKYFEECQDAHYEGDCFVFDQRVTVDSSLTETETTQCYRCQEPLTVAEQAQPSYVPGESCPYCYQKPDDKLAALLASRQAKIVEVTNPLPGSQPYTNRRPIYVAAKNDNRRLLDFLSELFPFSSREAWAERIEAGYLRRHSHPLIANDIVRAGDELEHVFPNTTEPDVNADIRILYEDEWLIGVHKPAPLPMHPCGRFNRNSLVRILGEVYPFKLRPAHRLDANTSGVVVFSLKQIAAQKLQPQFEKSGNIHKTYLAKVAGHPPEDEFSCDAGISAASVEAGARTIDADGLPARTEFHTLERFEDGTSLLQVHPITGRTNQIRLHLWHLGWPIVGDPMYLAGGHLAAKQTLSTDDPPLCLHAWQIEFDHPMTDESMTLRAPKPDWAGSVQLAN